MQELMVYAGQLDSYSQGNEILKEMIGVEVSCTQHYRVTDAYGAAASSVVNETRTLSPLQQGEVLYVQADGSFVLTRDEGWKEVKLGRFFKSGDCMEVSEERGWIRHSQYVVHLGERKIFTSTMDELIESYGPLGERLIFVSDGGVWLKNWMSDAFPKTVQILDFYHVLEYLHDFSSAHFKTTAKAKVWVQKQKEMLLKSQVKKVLHNIRRLKTTHKEAFEKIIQYFESNIERMDYSRYLKLGCGIIGSGAIESAHRTVIQHRMKQAGQRWTTTGAQRMLNLRVIKENGQWARIIDMATYGFKASIRQLMPQDVSIPAHTKSSYE